MKKYKTLPVSKKIKDKIGKTVWYENETWTVLEILRTVGEGLYILVRLEEDDGELPTLRLLEFGSDFILPNTEKVTRLNSKLTKLKNEFEEKRGEAKEALNLIDKRFRDDLFR